MIKKIKDIFQGKSSITDKRSSKWSKVRKEFLEQNPACAICGGDKKLEVHHIVPFNEDPSKELDNTNLITLCESKKYGVTCHLFFGHLGKYTRCNPDIAEDAKVWSEKLKKKK